MNKFSDEPLEYGSLSGSNRAHHEIQVLCASDERYLPHAATMLCSLLEHNKVLKIHYFYSSVASDELAKLRSMVSNYGSEIVFYEVVPETFSQLRIDKWASAAVYYRLLATTLLPTKLNKILYLDSDIIVRRSLDELWDTDLTNHALAAIPDYWQDAKSLEVVPAGEKLFNSGVLLINLKAWRQNDIPARAVTFIKENPEKVQFWDQEALNAVLARQWIELPPHWNAQGETHWFKGMRNPAIVHFIMSGKPWHWTNVHPFKSEYRRYRLMTPWSQYEQEGKPELLQRLLHYGQRLARVALPRSLRQWLRSQLTGSRA